jgi:uncharacterized protein DUF3352
MTEPRNDEPMPSGAAPDETPNVEPEGFSAAPTPPTPPTPPAEEAPTQAWASPATPSEAPAAGGMPLGTTSSTGDFEPAASLPSNRVDRVADTGTFGAPPASTSRRGTGLRWALAILGVVIVAAASFVIVSLVGGRPATSIALGYMPATITSYSEIRLDLPGDQREKLASFMKPFPGFSDPSAFDAKLNELLDRIVRSASHDDQTWTTDIAPWFGGQIAVGTGLPDPAALSGGVRSPMAGADNVLFAATIRDRAKAIAWIEKVAAKANLSRSTYGDADLLVNAAQPNFAIAVNDKVLLGGSTTAVKAAVDTNGKSAITEDATFKAALATVQKDYVMLGITNVHAFTDWFTKAMATSQPGVLEKSQIDETVLAMLPGWFATTGRFENDAFVSTSVGPAGAIGYDTTNHADAIVGHVPAGTILLSTEHDVGPAISAIVAKFRALPETAAFFKDFDRAVGVLGGFDAAMGWWGDTGFVVSKLPDGTVGGGLVIKPRDAAAADRLATTLNSLLAIGAPSQGAEVRTVDHNGTKITVLDFSKSPSFSAGSFPAGYKPELALATNADISVIGIGQAWVESVLDAGPGHSLADDARFKALLDRAGSDNIAVAFVDIAAIRGLLEPLAQQSMPADSWAYYAKEIQPYLKPLDALIGTGRKDGTLDRGVTIVTAH